jgi:tRNA-specific 2-thiouridylase
VLGRHPGVIHFTIGQRRGLGIGGRAEPLYVVQLDVDTHRVVVGPREALREARVPVAEINWLGDGAFDAVAERPVLARIRSTRPPRPATVRPTGRTTAEVILADPEEGVSPGQACVFYECTGTRVLGGGWIVKG